MFKATIRALFHQSKLSNPERRQQWFSGRQEKHFYPWVQFLWHSWHTLLLSPYFHTSVSSSPGTPWGHRDTQNSPSWKLAHLVQFPLPWKAEMMFTTVFCSKAYCVNSHVVKTWGDQEERTLTLCCRNCKCIWRDTTKSCAWQHQTLAQA